MTNDSPTTVVNKRTVYLEEEAAYLKYREQIRELLERSGWLDLAVTREYEESPLIKEVVRKHEEDIQRYRMRIRELLTKAED